VGVRIISHDKFIFLVTRDKKYTHSSRCILTDSYQVSLAILVQDNHTFTVCLYFQNKYHLIITKKILYHNIILIDLLIELHADSCRLDKLKRRNQLYFTPSDIMCATLAIISELLTCGLFNYTKTSNLHHSLLACGSRRDSNHCVGSTRE